LADQLREGDTFAASLGFSLRPQIVVCAEVEERTVIALPSPLFWM
jgi:hypothetical protein